MDKILSGIVRAGFRQGRTPGVRFRFGKRRQDAGRGSKNLSAGRPNPGKYAPV